MDKSLSSISYANGVNLYKIDVYDQDTHLASNGNHYYLLSEEKSRKLLAHPEVVSMDAYYALLTPTEYAFRYLLSHGAIEHPEICTILRGGLNYPLEEACYKAGLPIANIHFLSCERIIEQGVITGLDIKYNKFTPGEGVTLMIGDILASGLTFDLCIHKIIEAYRNSGCMLRRIIFFTIGGTRAFGLFDQLTEELRETWPQFEGIDCFFYEGAFSVYEDKGVLGFQIPEIDFYWNGGLITPEFRQYCMEHITPILEKCVIYDGGARRYNVPEHRLEVIAYWQEVMQKGDKIDLQTLFDERVGYPVPKDYSEWLERTGYQMLDADYTKKIYVSEVTCRNSLKLMDPHKLAQERINHVTNALLKY